VVFALEKESGHRCRFLDSTGFGIVRIANPRREKGGKALKQIVQPTAQPPQKPTAEPSARFMRQQSTDGRTSKLSQPAAITNQSPCGSELQNRGPCLRPQGGQLAQLAAMANGSPRVQVQRRLARDLRNSERVQGLTGLTAHLNPRVPTQLHGVPINDDAGLEREANVMGARAVQHQSSADNSASDSFVEFNSEIEGQFGTSLHNISVQRKEGDGVVQAVLDKFEIQTLYGTLHPTAIFPDPINAIFEREHVYIKTLLDLDPRTRQNQMKDLRLYLGSDGGNYERRFQLLQDYNARFGRRLYELKLGPAAYAPHAATRGLLDYLDTATAVVVNAARAVEAGPGGMQKLIDNYIADPTLARFARITTDINTAGGAYGNFILEDDVLQAGTAMRAAHPPNSNLGGLAWGVGNYGSIDQNKTEHFKKHCLRLGDGANPDPHEPWKWMQELNYDITRQFVIAHAPLVAVEDAAIFGAADRIGSQAGADYFFNVFLPGKNALIANLTALNQWRYVRHAQNATRAMNTIYVSLEGRSGFVQGQNGNVFLIGKWNGGFTLSSAYINTAKIVGNARFKLYDLQA
jgi:hypothetical protein